MDLSRSAGQRPPGGVRRRSWRVGRCHQLRSRCDRPSRHLPDGSSPRGSGHYSLKGPVETLIYPQRYRPRARCPKFPPWCYVRCVRSSGPTRSRVGACRMSGGSPGPTASVGRSPVRPSRHCKPTRPPSRYPGHQDDRSGYKKWCRATKSRVAAGRRAQAGQQFKESLSTTMNQGYDFGKRPMSVAEDGPRCEALRLARER